MLRTRRINDNSRTFFPFFFPFLFSLVEIIYIVSNFPFLCDSYLNIWYTWCLFEILHFCAGLCWLKSLIIVTISFQCYFILKRISCLNNFTYKTQLLEDETTLLHKLTLNCIFLHFLFSLQSGHSTPIRF